MDRITLLLGVFVAHTLIVATPAYFSLHSYFYIFSDGFNMVQVISNGLISTTNLIRAKIQSLAPYAVRPLVEAGQLIVCQPQHTYLLQDFDHLYCLDI